MGLFCLCGNDSVRGDSSSSRSQDAAQLQTRELHIPELLATKNAAALQGLPVQCVIDLLCSPLPLPLTARDFIEMTVLPKTKGLGGSYAQHMTAGHSQLDAPTLYVALSWDVALKPALHAVLQHLGVPESLLQKDAAAISSWVADQAGLASQRLFFDFLCIDFWADSSLPTPSASGDSISLATTSDTKKQHNTAEHPPKPEELQQLPPSDPQLQLLPGDRSLEAFIASIQTTLSSSTRPAVKLLLHLDPELRVLGSLIPMHAAWRAMVNGLDIQFACSPELAWPYQSPHANLFYTLNEAEEPNERIRQALVKDILDSAKPAEETSGMIKASGHMVNEQKGLWRALLQAATISSARQAIDVNQTVHHSFVRAVFLKLDGQYRESRDQLVAANAAMIAHGCANSTKCQQVLCLLVQVFLRLGSLLEAESIAKQALEISVTSGQVFSLLNMHTRACHALTLEALQRPSAAEQEWRSTYTQLVRHLGHRHPLTLEFMAHLGRLLSRLKGRQEEGAMLLSECLKGNVRLKGLNLASSSQSDLRVTAALAVKISPRQMQLLIARLSCDLAVVLRQVAAPPDEEDSDFSGGCHCTNQIMVAFQNMNTWSAGQEDAMPVTCKLSDSTLAEEEGLWQQALQLLEELCGVQHEASCLWRARHTAERLLSGIALDMSTGQLLPAAGVGAGPGSGAERGGSGAQASDPVVAGYTKHREAVRAAVMSLRAEIELLRSVLGPGYHISMLEAKSLLARTLEVLGSAAEAEVQWKLVADGCQHLLGEGSAHWAKAMTRLSGCVAKQGRYKEAAQHAAQAAAALVASTGQLSIQAGAALLRLAEMQREAGSLTDAELSLQQAIDVYKHCYGATNWRTKQVCSSLADLFDTQGKPQDAAQVRTMYKIQSSNWLAAGGH